MMVNYNRKTFIVQATSGYVLKTFFFILDKPLQPNQMFYGKTWVLNDKTFL
jgi:hypothetical protein